MLTYIWELTAANLQLNFESKRKIQFPIDIPVNDSMKTKRVINAKN